MKFLSWKLITGILSLLHTFMIWENNTQINTMLSNSEREACTFTSQFMDFFISPLCSLKLDSLLIDIWIWRINNLNLECCLLDSLVENTLIPHVETKFVKLFFFFFSCVKTISIYIKLIDFGIFGQLLWCINKYLVCITCQLWLMVFTN